MDKVATYKEEIYKRASEADDIKNSAKLIGGTAAAGAGSKGIMNQIKKGNLTGRETLYHNTRRSNVDNILKGGVRSSYATDPENITNLIVSDVPMDKKKGLTYFGRNKGVADGVGLTREMVDNRDLLLKPTQEQMLRDAKRNNKTLRVNAPTWKMETAANPELRGARNSREFSEIMDGVAKKKGAPEAALPKPLRRLINNVGYKSLGEKGTKVIKGDVGPEFVKGSEKYVRNSPGEIASFIKNNPKRFRKGSLKAGLGLGALLGGGGAIRSAFSSKEEEDFK